MARAAQVQVQRGKVKGYAISSPIGGLNAVNGLAAMPPGDCALLWNLVPSENGLRTRLGYAEYALGLTGPVRTMLSFTGASPVNNKFFAVTTEGIYNVTPGGTISATPMITFVTKSGDAGYGIGHNFVTPAGHFMVYADEVNGYYVYSETQSSWVKVVQASSTPWATGQTYAVNDYVTSNGVTYQCVSGSGPSGATAPIGTGASVSDGGYTWSYAPSISGFDPSEVAFVAVWKHRLFLVQRGTANAWYLDLNSLFGPATRVSFAGRFKAGGALRGLWNWTYEGGAGPDDRLVAASDGGDVTIYEGTDPSIPGAFTLKGTWFVGGFPAGRRICTDAGGDLLMLTRLGALPLSKLIVGNPTEDKGQYATFKISNLFSYLINSYGANKGWSLAFHPQDGTLLVNIPYADGKIAEQLVMSVTSKGWSRYSYSNLDIGHFCAFDGKMYFGTYDGRVVLNDGYTDGATIADPNAAVPVEFFLLTSFQKLGSIRQKRVQMIRVNASSDGTPPSYRVKPLYRYELSQFTGGGTVSALSGFTFGGLGATFGTIGPPEVVNATFGGFQAIMEQRTAGGTAGIGPEVAIAMSGKITARTTLIGWDVIYDEGGLL